MRCPSCGHDAAAIGGRCVSCGRSFVGHVATGVLTPVPDPVDAPRNVPPPDSANSPTVAFTGPLPTEHRTAFDAPSSVAGGVVVPGQAFGPRYHIIRLLGAGGMGAVYQAWDDELGVAVAIKIIRPEISEDPEHAEQMARRFKRELLLARQVTHRHVVRIHDLGEIDGIKYITMPYIQGTTLAAILRREGRLSVGRAVTIAREVAAGMQAAHDVGVVHRDLKPANVMIDADGHAVITDFGIARSMAGSQAMTAVAAVVGTIEYMAPEQARAETVDHRADIYAFGLVLRDMIAGRRPAAGGETAVAELMRRMMEPPPPLRSTMPEISEAVEGLVDKCLQPDPAQRYQSMGDVLADLESLDDHGHLRQGTTRSLPRPMRRRIRWRAQWVAIGLAAAAVVLGSIIVRDRLPFRRQAAPRAGAVSSTSLAILPFRNASGDASLDWLGSSLAEMLRADVGQSSHLRTVSSDRVQQVLRDLRVAPDTSLDPATLRKLATFTSADRIVWGQYLKFGAAIRVDAVVEDPAGRQSIPLKAEAAGDSGLLAAVADLAESVRRNLSLAPDIVNELRAKALKPSSQNVQALRYYSEGVQLARQGKHAEALKRFEASVGEDSEFALAYSKIGQEQANLGYDNEAQRASRKAVELSDTLPPQERYLILANHARVLNDTAKAIESYENLLKASPGDTDVYFELARLYETAGSLDLARERFASVLEHDAKNLQALLAMGRVEIRRRNPQGSLEFLTQALTLSIELENDAAKGDSLNAIGIAYKRLNKPGDALRYYQESLDLKRRLGQKGSIANTLAEIAQVQDMLGRPDEALKNYNEALQLRREIGDKRGLGNSLLDLASYHADRGRLDDALTLNKEALQIQRELGNRSYEALALNNIGNTYLSKGQTDDAVTYFERALQLRETLKVPGDTALTLHNLAETSKAAGQYDRSLAYHLRALELWRTAGDKRSAATESKGIGVVFGYQGRYGAALAAESEAVSALRELRDRSIFLADTLVDYGEALSHVGRFDDASKAIDEALDLGRELKSEPVIAKALSVKGENALYRGEAAPAKATLEEASQLRAAAADRRLGARIKINLARIALQDGRVPAAVTSLRELKRVTSTLGLKYWSVECSLSEAEALVAAKDYARARAAAETALAESESLGLQALAARSHAVLASALRASGGSERDAARHLATARQILDGIRKEARTDQVLARADLATLFTGAGAPPPAPRR